MSARLKPAPVSIQEYLEGEKGSEIRHEYIEGEVFAMAGGTEAHNIVCSNVIGSLFPQLKGTPCRAYGSDMKLKLETADDNRFYYPDGMVVCGDIQPKNSAIENPTLLVEVLSDSTRATDQREKRSAYLSLESLKILLLIEPESAHITCYRRGNNGNFTQTHFEKLSDTIPLPEISGNLPLVDIYDRLDVLA